MLDMDVSEKLLKARSDSETILNNAHQELHRPHTSKEHTEFCLLKIQAAIIQFELCSGIITLSMAKEGSFANKVMLKGLIHIVYEYKKSLKDHHIKTMIALCDSKSFASEKARLSRIVKKYRQAIKALEEFKPLRNVATGHYDPDISKQVSAIESVVEEKTLEALRQFCLFDKDILASLVRVGRKQ